MTADMPLTELFDNVNTCQHKKTLLVLHTSIRDLLQNSCPTGTRLVKDHSCWCVIPVPFFMLTCIYTLSNSSPLYHPGCKTQYRITSDKNQYRFLLHLFLAHCKI